MILYGRGDDKGFDAGERVHRRDINCGEEGGEVGVAGKEREVED